LADADHAAQHCPQEKITTGFFFELLCDLGLRELDEMTTGKHTLSPFYA
jgi:hypothetical protein